MRRFRSTFRSPLLALLIVSGAGGCSTYQYEIVLRPDGDAIERQLTCWKEQTNTASLEDFPRERLERIATAYSTQPAAKLNQKHSFKGRFVGKMPADVGGSGTYVRWTCSFGTAAAYMERFGGNDDIAQQVKDRQQATNRLVDLVIGWFEAELAGEPNWNSFRQFLDTQVRRDLENISYMFLLAGGVGQESDPPTANKDGKGTLRLATVWTRLWQYLVERDYVEPRDLPSFLGSDGSLLVPSLERLVHRKLGVTADAPRPAALAFLANTEAAKASLDRYLSTTPEFLKLQRAWQERTKKNPDESPPDPVQALSELIGASFFQISFEPATKLSIILACGEPPAATNGIWDDSKREVYWKTIQKGSQGLPTFIYAMWSAPLAEAQIKQFGKIVLTGENLFAYMMWYRGLSNKQVAEWDAFLATLRPGSGLRLSLKQFRFSDDLPLPSDPKESVPNSLADEPRRLILMGLSSVEEN